MYIVSEPSRWAQHPNLKAASLFSFSPGDKFYEVWKLLAPFCKQRKSCAREQVLQIREFIKDPGYSPHDCQGPELSGLALHSHSLDFHSISSSLNKILSSRSNLVNNSGKFLTFIFSVFCFNEMNQNYSLILLFPNSSSSQLPFYSFS